MEKNPIFYIYSITNKILNKKYIGSRVCYKDKIENDNYWGSSKYLQRDYKIFGKENFIKEIISIERDQKDLFEIEAKFILKYNTLEPNGYNRFLPNKRNGFSTRGCHHSEETKQKMISSSIGKNKGRILSEEHKQKISKSSIGKHIGEIRSEETKRKISQSNKGLNKNRPCSEEKKEKLRKALLGKNRGKIRSDETKEKMRIAKLGKNKKDIQA
ncbi:MAG: NUMOD3 motif (2 copies) [Firmicutes bacterium ADurb.Bin080]|jgi:group I intron endonuclease|nr:MAG: NUMOD3 motif (2 copies) [Firmicutes bacterium ADurb.Bin080]